MIGSDVGFILRSNSGEVFCYTPVVPYGLLVAVDEVNGLGSLVSSSNGSNEGNTAGSFIGGSRKLDDGIALCSSGDFFDGNRDGMFVA